MRPVGVSWPPRWGTAPSYRQEELLEKICAEAAARGVEAFVVGLPRNMDGSEGESAAAARGFASAQPAQRPARRAVG